VLLLVVLLGAAGWGAYNLMEELVVPVLRPKARDYLAFRRAEKHAEVLLAAAAESDVDPCLLAALMVVESSGRVGARSKKDALGLFQLKLKTAVWRAELLGLEPPTEEALLSDPLLNARLGADNLAWLLEIYDGDLERALIAYNAGPGRLAQLAEEAGGYQRWREGRARAGDSQLLGYVAKVLDYRDRFVARGLFAREPDVLPAR
jgi:soluble lytic murein transglycosylase